MRERLTKREREYHGFICSSSSYYFSCPVFCRQLSLASIHILPILIPNFSRSHFTTLTVTPEYDSKSKNTSLSLWGTPTFNFVPTKLTLSRSKAILDSKWIPLLCSFISILSLQRNLTWVLVNNYPVFDSGTVEGRKTEMLGSGMNLITTVIGFGMSATFIVFVCTRLICGRIRAAESGPVFELDDSITDLEQAEHRIGGLEPVLVAALPTMKFNRADFQSAEDAQCTICLGEYQEKEVLRIMPKCGHNFHLVCIDVWLRKQSTCPVCRLPLQDVFETKHLRSPMFGAVLQSMDQPHSLIEYPHQWSLPSREPSSENGNNGNPGPIGNSERTVNVETENRR